MHPWLNGMKLKAVYHDFQANECSQDFGSEIDLSIWKGFDAKIISPWLDKGHVVLKYADFNAEDGAGFNDVQKVWLQVGVKF